MVINIGRDRRAPAPCPDHSQIDRGGAGPQPHSPEGGAVARTEHRVAIVGVGTTPLSRQPEAAETDLAVQACRAAAEDAGIDPADLDGINIQVHHYPPPDTEAIVKELGMREVSWTVDGGLGVGSLARAAQVVDSGIAKAIVVCKVMNTVAPVDTPEID